MKILLIQTAFIGDVILTTPLIAAIKKNIPSASLTVVVKPEAMSLLDGNPDVNEVLVIEKRGKHRGMKGLLSFIREIRNRNFDMLLSPHKSHRTSFIAWMSGIPVRYGFSDAGMSVLAYTKTVKHHRELPEIRRLLRFFQDSTGYSTLNHSTDMFLFENPESMDNVDRLLSEHKIHNLILVGASSVWETKRWTTEGFCDLIYLLLKTYKSPVALIGAPGDKDLSQEVIQRVKEKYGENLPEEMHNFCGKTDLPGLYSLMKRSSMLIANDSAPVHFACAARIPVVAIFGPTVPSLGYAPLTPESRIAELPGLDCRPCGSHGHRQCPRGHFLCMNLLGAERVMELAKEVLPP